MRGLKDMIWESEISEAVGPAHAGIKGISQYRIVVRGSGTRTCGD